MVRWAQPMPAELTRARSGPRDDRGVYGVLDLLGVGDVDGHEHTADLLGEGLSAFRLKIGDDDPRAEVGQLAC